MVYVQSCCLINLTYYFFDVLVAVADAFVDVDPDDQKGIYFTVKLILPHMAP